MVVVPFLISAFRFQLFNFQAQEKTVSREVQCRDSGATGRWSNRRDIDGRGEGKSPQ